MRNGVVTIAVLSRESSSFPAGLRSALAGDKELRVLFSSPAFIEILDLAGREKPDIILYHDPVPLKVTLAEIRRLRKASHRTKLILAVGHPHVHFAVKAYNAGASGYFTETAGADEVLQCIRKVAAGGRYVPPWLAGEFVEELQNPSEPEPHEKLTVREYHIMYLLATDMPLQEIAGELNIREKTVASYRATIMQKMGFSYTEELKKYIAKYRLADPGRHNI